MTTIYCSNKLKDFLGSSGFSNAGPASALGDWNAHLFHFARRKHLIFVNNITRYCVIAEDVLKPQLKDLDAFFTSTLAAQLSHDGIIGPTDAPAIAERILPLVLSPPNNDRSVLGNINEFIFAYKVSRENPYWIGKRIEEIAGSLNSGPVGIKGKYSFPVQTMTALFGTSESIR